MNPFEMVLGIIIVVTIGRVVMARLGYVRSGRRDYIRNAMSGAPPYDAENERLRDEVKGLKERIAVLERLATDNNRALDLDREIEKLR